MHAKIVAVTMM